MHSLRGLTETDVQQNVNVKVFVKAGNASKLSTLMNEYQSDKLIPTNHHQNSRDLVHVF